MNVETGLTINTAMVYYLDRPVQVLKQKLSSASNLISHPLILNILKLTSCFHCHLISGDNK